MASCVSRNITHFTVSFTFCRLSKGLLIGLSDDTHYVHNPATKEAFVVPKSPMIDKYGVERDTCLIVRGFGGFVLVRFFCSRQLVEYYSSKDGGWFQFWSQLDNDLRNAGWCHDNYVAIIVNGRRLLFFLPDMDRGVVIKFGKQDEEHSSVVCSFSLP
ncbi:hypothetical protein RND81_05G129300 [Saponaria officinalis]|uniref:F-box protein n=1 Tax=Saponaria officinalis TaxID=3572 RepID=A0AAW1KWI6_SAPOF